MEQYISKTALVAEIEKQIEFGKFKCQQSQENNDYESYVAWSEHIATCGKILLFINTLEVKEADDFIEKACKWIESEFKIASGYYSLDDFKKYMKGE